MKFRLTLTDEDGIVLDRWSIAADSDASITYPLQRSDGDFLVEEINRDILSQD